MLGAQAALQAQLGPNFQLDAAVSRQFGAAIDIARRLRDAGQLGDEVIVHLGTNGTVGPGQFDDMMHVLSGVRRVVIVNAKVDRPWEQEVNDTLAAGVKQFPNAVLVDWHKLGWDHPELFWRDGIHLTPDGARTYAQLIALHL